MTMRISTKMMYDTGVTQITSQQTALAHTQSQLSTGKKNLNAADDPVASARAVEVTQQQSINTQLVTNRSNAKSVMSLETVALASVTSTMQSVKSLVVEGGNGSMTQSDRESIATQLEGSLADLLGQANTSDGLGGYIFSGYKATTVPYTQTATGATYQGDQGQRSLQVGSTRTLPITDSGSSVFESNLTGNGTFATAPDAGNYDRGGSGIISPGSVSDPAALTGHPYQIAFQVTAATPGTPATTTYTVTDTTTGEIVPAGSDPQPYVSGQTIAFDGMSMDVKGAPADGDSFTVQPSTKESLFTTMTNLIAALRAPADGAAGQARLSNALNTAQTNLDTAYTNVLSVQSAIGSRLNEIDYLDTSGDDLGLQYSTTLSNLQDVDSVAAISLFTQQQTTLDAAQKSFKTMTSLSLFNYIS